MKAPGSAGGPLTGAISLSMAISLGGSSIGGAGGFHASRRSRFTQFAAFRILAASSSPASARYSGVAAMTASQSFAAISLVALSCLAPNAAAQEFRIETDVFLGEEEQPHSQTTTLFEKSAVYEFIDNPAQTIVYRRGSSDDASLFILLDPETQQRTDVDVSRIDKLMAKLNGWAADQKSPLMKFSAEPRFEETFDADSGSLTLANPQWTYQVATVRGDDKAALARYRDFIDRYTALTSMLNNSPVPPGPRLALNAALDKHKVVPVEIRRTLDGDEKNQIRAAHLFSWRLSREDRVRIDEAQASLANFKKVDNKEFLTARAAKEKEVVRGQSE